MDFLNLILKPEINQQIGGLILGFVFNEIIKNKSKFLSYIINWIFQIFPWRNFNGILYINFSKTAKNMTDKTKQFRSDNFKIIKRTNYKCFDKNSGEINSNDLLIEVHNKHSILLQKISEKLLKINELVYAGFPHIPFGVLDGYKLKQTENVRFLEYLKSNNSSHKKIIELDKKYNMPIKIISTPLIDCNLSEEIILKIENSFAIKDNEINKISKNAKILKF